jgi:GT2 family glycosyltransferase
MTRERCSIVIPVHNKAALTRQCLDSIFANPPAVDHEVLVVDDASTDETPAMLAEYGDAVKHVRLERNAGFATACNTGAAAAEGGYLVFLNNDTIAQPGWLDALAAYADTHDVAVVGSKLLFPDGTVQHAGVVFGFQGDPLHIYAGCPADHPAVNKSRPFQSVTAACVLVRRDAFEQVGGFDTGYHNDLEDVDLCLRLGQEGHEVHYCHESVLYHLESASRGQSNRPKHSARVYRERWGRSVRHDELLYYLDDGLLDLVRLPPDRVRIDDGRHHRELELIHARMIQLLRLLRETVLLAMYAPAAKDRGSRGKRMPLRMRRRVEKRLTELRGALAAEMSHEAAHAQGEPDAAGQAEPAVATKASAPAPAAEPAPEPAPVEPDTVPAEQPAAEEATAPAVDEYPALLARLLERLDAVLPVGTTFAVATRGDDRMLAVPGREGMHFPRADDGRHLGYHPATGEEAVDHLDELRALGAEYIVFPATELWWLDYYEELAERLHGTHIETLDEAGVGIVFELAERPVAELVRSLVPPDEKLAVASRFAADLAGLGSRRPVRFDIRLGEEEALAHLERLRAAGVRYLVVPHHAFAWVDSHPRLAQHLSDQHRVVTRQRRACAIWELAPAPPRVAPAQVPPAAADHGRARRRGLRGRRLFSTRSRGR